MDDGRGTPKDQPGRGQGDPGPLFGARIGSRLVDMQEVAGDVQRAAGVGRTPECPLCRGSLAEREGLLVCEGRCAGRWLVEAGGRLVDVAALPLGVCVCCERRQALVAGERGAVCPASGRAHVGWRDGAMVLADMALEGVCQCCAPAMALVWDGERLVCSGKRERVYERRGDGVALVESPGGTGVMEEAWAAIDEALWKNSARVMVNGWFEVGG